MIKADRYRPCAILQPFVKTMMIIESESGMENKLLPDTSLVMAFRLKGHVTALNSLGEKELSTSVITGLRKSARTVIYQNNTSVLLVIFKEAGASAFFKTPTHEFFGQSLALDQFISKEKISEIEENLFYLNTNAARFKLVENFLLTKLQNGSEDRLVLNAVHKIKTSKGNVTIKSLANSLCISQDPFEKRFRKATGTSPKHFSSIIRLRNLITNYSNTSSLTEIAYTAGYYDQAHFIKAFKTFTGQTPHVFFQSDRYW